MITNKWESGPWSRLTINEEPTAKAGLRKRREQLEAIVEPFVTTRSTNDEILFKGKRRYLVRPHLQLDERSFHAVLALQLLYVIERAWKAGDIDAVVRATVGFANADHDIQLLELSGVGSVHAAILRDIRRGTSRKAAARTNLRRRKKRPDYSAEVAALMAGGTKYTPACEEVAKRYGKTWETVRNNTPELRPRRPKPK